MPFGGVLAREGLSSGHGDRAVGGGILRGEELLPGRSVDPVRQVRHLGKQPRTASSRIALTSSGALTAAKPVAKAPAGGPTLAGASPPKTCLQLHQSCFSINSPRAFARSIVSLKFFTRCLVPLNPIVRGPSERDSSFDSGRRA